MHEELLPAMAFPSPSITLLKRAAADVHNRHLRTWVQTLPARIQQYLMATGVDWRVPHARISRLCPALPA